MRAVAIAIGRIWSSPHAPAWAQFLAAVITLAVMAWYAHLTARLTHLLVQAEIEPVIGFEVDPSEHVVVVANEGDYPIEDVSINVETHLMVGPPDNHALFRKSRMRDVPGKPRRDWRYLERVGPGEIVRASINDELAQTLREQRLMEEVRRDPRSWNPRPPKGELYYLMKFRLSYRRAFDKRRYTDFRTIYVAPDARTGEPWVADAEMLPFQVPASLDSRQRGRQ